MTINPIKGNGTRKVELDMGMLNCVNEPYVIDVNGNKFILRYRMPGEGEYGTLSLEALADDAS